MAFFGDKINDTVVIEKKNFDPIPAGWYKATVSACEYKDTKSGGGMIAMTWDILSHTSSSKVFENYNIRNTNPETEGYARESLRSIEAACGLGKCTDTDQYIGATCEVKVAIAPAKDGYDAKNTIKGYRKIEGSTAMPTAKVNPFGRRE